MTKPVVKKWVLSPHAAKRMIERGVLVDDIQLLIESPDFLVAQGPKWIFAKAFSARQDNVVAAILLERKEKDLWIVITVMVNFLQK
jgi:hypothetical protein